MGKFVTLSQLKLCFGMVASSGVQLGDPLGPCFSLLSSYNLLMLSNSMIFCNYIFGIWKMEFCGQVVLFTNSSVSL